MSSPDALATVTATLMGLLSSVIKNQPEPGVTAKAPSVARKDRSDKQINIFLYSTHYNTAFRNAPMPGTARNGESAYSPLPLVLKYLITTYGEEDKDISGQMLMGHVMSILHDNPILSGADILSGTEILSGESDVEVIDSNLDQQIERIKITPDMLTLDDMSKLWTSFQSAEYRLSTGYEVSVVLIESTRATKTPLPVLKRGEDGQGVNVVAAPTSSLSGLRFANQKPSAELGDRVTLLGDHLSSDNTVVRLQHSQLDNPIDIQPEPTKTETEMLVQLPTIADDTELGSKWPAGFYTLSLLIQQPDTPAWTSNSVSLPLSPTMQTIDPSPATAPAGDVVLTIACIPQIKEAQRVSLLFSDQVITPDSMITPADNAAPTTLIFTVENAAAKTTPYVLRLRVDGVDSLPVDFSGNTPQFADNQKVTIT